MAPRARSLLRSTCLTLLAASAVGDEGLASTPLGDVRGLVTPNGIAYLGIPYAAPPVGVLRWQDPQPVAPWAPATLNATRDPPGCVQACAGRNPPHVCPVVVQEDCLYLNVWTPRMPDGLPAKPLPVLLWIHGGNFKNGYAGGLDAAGGLLYDGRPLANDSGVISVVINYRLGSLGFLYLGEGTGVTGNYGLEDQVAAMRFVRANIAAFGGDPSRLTLAGQSAGAMSIAAHLTRPATAGLYDGVIEHSNPFGIPWRDAASATGLGAALANFSGCPSRNLTQAAACLRAVDAPALLAAQLKTDSDLVPDLSQLLLIVDSWSPTTGTAYLPRAPLAAFVAGDVLDVPIIIGTTTNESVIFVWEVVTFPLPMPLYDVLLAVLMGSAAANASGAPGLYPVPDPPPADARLLASAVMTDGLFGCATRNATEALAAAKPARASPTYVYSYPHVLSWGAGAWGANFSECITQACHGADLPEFWHPTDLPEAAYTPEEDALAAAWHGYWGNFARTGDPNGGALPAWPPYTPATRRALVLDVASAGGVAVAAGLRAHWCDWWDAEVGYSIY